jgi:hypothetical protein
MSQDKSEPGHGRPHPIMKPKQRLEERRPQKVVLHVESPKGPNNHMGTGWRMMEVVGFVVRSRQVAEHPFKQSITGLSIK